MSTRFDNGPDLLELVRRADPMRDPRVQADAGLDTESALRSLASELGRPAPPRTTHRRRTALRTAVLAVAIAATVFVVANVASTGNDSAVHQRRPRSSSTSVTLWRGRLMRSTKRTP